MPKKIKLNGRSLNDAMYLLSINSIEASDITGLSATTISELCKQSQAEVHKKTYGKLSKLFIFIFTKDNIAVVDKVKRFPLFGKREVILKHVPAVVVTEGELPILDYAFAAIVVISFIFNVYFIVS